MGDVLNQESGEEKRRDLRKSASPAETLLWQQVRNRQLGGFKFRRQYGIAHFVADFCCTDCRLIVELDGVSHDSDIAIRYDASRQQYFESLGFLVVRFNNQQVYFQMTAVLENLLNLCEERKELGPVNRTTAPAE